MSRRDFEASTPGEFEAICRAYHEAEESRMRESWERTRMLAAIVIQPHVKKRVTPRELLPFPWDNRRPDAPVISKEEQRRRVGEILKRI